MPVRGSPRPSWKTEASTVGESLLHLDPGSVHRIVNMLHGQVYEDPDGLMLADQASGCSLHLVGSVMQGRPCAVG